MSTVMGSGSLENRLQAVMKSWKLPIDPGCEQHLNQLIQKAAQRMEDKGLADDLNELREAEVNFRRLLTEMTLQANAQGFHKLNELMFFEALGSLCPIWPFC